MDTTTFLSQVFGLLYLTIGLGMLVSKDHYQGLMQEMTSSKTFLYFGGVVALIVGFLITKYHSMWDGGNDALLIALIGWVAFIKGIVLLVKPSSLSTHMQFWSNRYRLTILVTVFLGAFLSYYGFMV